MKRIYIAGPMRGFPRWNFDMFADAADAWRRRGWIPISPAAVDLALGFDPDGPEEQVDDLFVRQAMLRDTVLICGCDALAILPGWRQSRGARCEVALARAIGLPVYDSLTAQEVRVDV